MKPSAEMKKPEPAPGATSARPRPSAAGLRDLGIEPEGKPGNLDQAAARPLAPASRPRSARPPATTWSKMSAKLSGAPCGGAKARPLAPAVGASRPETPATWALAVGPVDDPAGRGGGGEGQADDGPQNELLALHHRHPCRPLVGCRTAPSRLRYRRLRRYANRRREHRLIRRERPSWGDVASGSGRTCLIARTSLSRPLLRASGARSRPGGVATRPAAPARRQTTRRKRPEPQQPGPGPHRRLEQDEVAVAPHQVGLTWSSVDPAAISSRTRRRMSPAMPAGLSAIDSCWQTTQRRSSNRAWARASWAASGSGRSGGGGGFLGEGGGWRTEAMRGSATSKPFPWRERLGSRRKPGLRCSRATRSWFCLR